MKHFSRKYKTFSDWLEVQSRDSKYAKRIIRFHERFPQYNLKELREIRVKDYNLSLVPWESLTSQQRRDRLLSLQIVRALRKGDSLTQATQELSVNKDFAVKHLGNYLTKSGGRWKVTAADKIQAEMRIYEKNVGAITIVTADSKDRSLIAEYFSCVQKAMKKNDESCLKKFKDIRIVDASGKVHRLETDLDKLYEIEEAIEEPEFLEIYKY